ncbi:hypothetical protein CYY_008668 [Polysphondylium violaceum]|uniref:WH2 domain-containing protein n=1 Tax=Polysphondylium violaceum TaxID=133409 RepID=A0A8J4PNZ3_9MYCE|nr:hypothetical protein CYY_008668 [Polysphondylium violaceum]
MVLITRYLPSINDNNKPNVENIQNKDQITDAVLHNNTVGIINQLMVLAHHANNIFKSLADESTAVVTRLNKLNSRIPPLMAMLPNIEAHHTNTSIESMNSKPRAEYHAENAERHQHFTHGSIPASVNQVYQEKCKPPPKLHLLDAYMDEGQKSLKLYTNPDFFIDEWVAEQQKQREEARQRRRERREARLKKKGEKVEGTEVKKVKRVQKVRYDPVTGEKIIITVDGPAANTPPPSRDASHQQQQQYQQQAPAHHQPQFSAPPPPQTAAHFTPPPPPMNQFNTPPPLQSNPSFSGAFSSPPPPSSTYSPPPQQNISHHHAPSAPTSAPPPPPPPPPPSAPAPPPPPSFKSSVASEGAAAKPKASDARSDLLTSIISGISLKPAEERKIAEPVAKKEEGLNVADILARRIAWAASDSEDDDDSDEDSDWD